MLTTVESGPPEMVADAWVGVMAPANLPKPAVHGLYGLPKPS